VRLQADEAHAGVVRATRELPQFRDRHNRIWSASGGTHVRVMARPTPVSMRTKMS